MGIRDTYFHWRSWFDFIPIHNKDSCLAKMFVSCLLSPDLGRWSSLLKSGFTNVPEYTNHSILWFTELSEDFFKYYIAG